MAYPFRKENPDIPMKKLLTTLLACGCSPLVLAEGSPWVPGDGEITISADLTTGASDDFFIGDVSTDLGGDIEGTFLWFNGVYGYDDRWAFDFRTGYAQSQFETNPVEQEDISDTSIGVSYQLLNEFEADNGLPTVTVRAGITVGGDYETDVIDAIGDGASGLDLSLLVGKSLTNQFSVSGDLTFRQRNEDVADAVKYLVTGFYSTPLPGLGLRLSVGGSRTDSDVNIGDPGFGVEQFPQTDRDLDVVIGGANYGFENGIGLSLSYVALVDGTNVSDTDVTTFSLSYSF